MGEASGDGPVPSRVRKVEDLELAEGSPLPRERTL